VRSDSYVLDPQVREFLDGLPSDGSVIGTNAAEMARVATRELLSVVDLPGPEVRSTSDFGIPTVDGELPARAYVPHSGGQGGVIVYYHGGGWVTGDLESHDGMCRRLARLTDCEIVNVNYRHAPEHRYPAAADDAFAAAAWAYDEACAGRPLVVAGDSAGGNLAAATALRARDLGRPVVALQVLLYPVLNHDFDTYSYANYGEGLLLQRADMKWFWDQYAPHEAQRNEPYASPLLALSLVGVAPAIVVLPEFDPLHSEGLAYVRRLRASNVPVESMSWPGMLHGFMSFPAVFDAALDALSNVAGAIRAAVIAADEGSASC